MVFHICTNNVYISKMECRLSFEVKDHKVKETQRLDLLPKSAATSNTLEILTANVNTLPQSQRPRPFEDQHFS